MNEALATPPRLVTSPAGGATPESGATTRPTSTTAGRWGTVAYRVLLALLVTAGSAVVLRIWWSARPIWNDEAQIALNLRDKSWLGLTRGLAYEQVAPVGWLWLEKLVLTTAGRGELSLGFISTAATVAVLIMGPYAARLAAGRFASLITAALLAISTLLIKFSGELKQYVFEAAVAIALLLLGHWTYRRLVSEPAAVVSGGGRGLASASGFTEVTRHARPSARSLLLAAGWLALTLVAVFVSLSAVLVLAGVVGGLMLTLARARRWRDAMWLGLLSVPAGLFAGYLVYRRMQYPLMPGQTDYFRDGVPPPHGGLGGIMAWLPRNWHTFVTGTLQWEIPVLALVLALLGVASLIVRGRLYWAAMLAGTLLAAIGAAAARALPMADRVAIYLIGPATILVAVGIDGLARATAALWRSARAAEPGSPVDGAAPRPPLTGGQRAVRLVGAGICAVALVGAVAGQVPQLRESAVSAYEELKEPSGRDGFRAALALVAAEVQPGDAVIIDWFGHRVARWYAPGLKVKIHAHVRLLEPGTPGCVDRSAQLDERLRGVRRVFYVEGRPLSSAPNNQFALVVAQLSNRGHVADLRQDSMNARGGRYAIAVVDLTAPPDRLPPVIPDGRPLTCVGLVRGLDFG